MILILLFNVKVIVWFVLVVFRLLLKVIIFLMFEFLFDGNIFIVLFMLSLLDVKVFWKFWKFKFGCIIYCIGKWVLNLLLILVVGEFLSNFSSGFFV